MQSGAPSAFGQILSSSLYLPTRTGTRLALYLFRPDTQARVPAVWTHNRYHAGRASEEDARAWAEQYPWLRALVGEAPARRGPARISIADTPWLASLVQHGYAVAFVDARGTGASFGARRGPFSPEEARDAADVTAWLAAQPWSTGAVGMFGRSYMGTAQYFAAAEGPGLGALFPEMPLFELYDLVYPGGIFRHAFGRKWVDDVTSRDQGEEAPAPLDADPDGSLLAAARAEHAANLDSYAAFAALPYRDSVDPRTGARPFLERSPSCFAADRRPRTPLYLLAGWSDAFVRDAILWYQSATGPRRLVIGPWAHTGSLGFDLFEQHAWWYDRWLRGAEAAEEPPIYFLTQGATAGDRWRDTDVWPVRGMAPTPYHLRAGRAETCRSVNDGRLTLAPAPPGEPGDERAIDYTATTGAWSRWANACGSPLRYPDLSANDEKALTYTTERLAAPLELTGHPVVRLWIRASAPDVDVFAYLEEVAEDGRSLYVTEGALRASHRALAAPPFELLGLPYHRSYAADVAPLPDEPVELCFDLHPISRLFGAGRRIRLTIAGADRDNALTPQPPGGVILRVLHDAAHPSQIVLPVVPR